MCKSKIECERRKYNREKFIEKDRQYYEKNKQDILARNMQYRADNREQIIQQKKQYYQNNREVILQNLQQHKQDRNLKKKERYQNDVMFRISESLKARISDVLKNKKGDKTNILIGCSKNELKTWLAFQFDIGLS